MGGWVPSRVFRFFTCVGVGVEGRVCVELRCCCIAAQNRPASSWSENRLRSGKAGVECFSTPHLAVSLCIDLFMYMHACGKLVTWVPSTSDKDLFCCERRRQGSSTRCGRRGFLRSTRETCRARALLHDVCVHVCVPLPRARWESLCRNSRNADAKQNFRRIRSGIGTAFRQR